MSEAEIKLNPYGKNADLPDGTVIVSNYAEYRRYVSDWASGKFPGTLIVIGAAGIGKSETALACLSGVEHCYIKGRASKKAVYLEIANHVDEPIVIDDVDELLSDQSVTGLLKALLETRNPKIVQWKTGVTMSQDSDVPPEIITKSRTMILCNELKQVSKNFGAVLDRSTVIYFAPSAEEIHQYVGSWFDVKGNADVYNYIGERITFSPSPSCRPYFKAAQWKQAAWDWRIMVDQMLKPSDQVATLVRELLASPEYKTDTERLEVFKQKSGMSEQHFYRLKKLLNLAVGKTSKRAQAISEAMKRKHAERKASGKIITPNPKGLGGKSGKKRK